MKKESPEKRRTELANKKRKNASELIKLERELVEKLCPKGYKKECEPAYCMFRITDTCPFLKKWREISKDS